MFDQIICYKLNYAPKDWVFCCGRLERHGAGKVAGVGAALEVHVVFETPLVQSVVLDHMVAVTHSVSLQLVNRLDYKQTINHCYVQALDIYNVLFSIINKNINRKLLGSGLCKRRFGDIPPRTAITVKLREHS